MKKTMAMAWMLGMALAWGEEPMVPPQWTVQFETGNVLTTSYAPAPIRIQTATGNLTFVPEELERIEFPMVNQCVVATVYGDRWLTPGGPKDLPARLSPGSRARAGILRAAPGRPAAQGGRAGASPRIQDRG